MFVTTMFVTTHTQRINTHSEPSRSRRSRRKGRRSRSTHYPSNREREGLHSTTEITNKSLPKGEAF
jgi:hypothetical protein